MLIDPRTILAVLLTLTLVHIGLGRDLPLDTSASMPFVESVILFIGYLYLARTLVRLPFALVITVRRTRYALQKHGLGWRDSLRDGFTRGFLDARRWTVPPLASIDRLAVIGLTLLATTPYLGIFLVRLVGLVGMILLIILYLFRGTFGLLVEDKVKSIQRLTSLPFIDD
jgi:hypothetical protein